MRVAMIVGHDADRQGASHNGLSEFDFTSQLLVSMYKSLPPDHTFATFYRSADVLGYTAQMEDLHERLGKWGCELAIELHLNDFHDSYVDGHEVLVMSDTSKIYGDKLNSKFTQHLSNNNRGVKKIRSSDNGYGFLSRGEYPCLIAEPFFVKHIGKYVHGQEERSDLILAYTEFLKEL